MIIPAAIRGRGSRQLARVPADDQQADQYGTDQHDHPDIQAGMEGLVASGGPQKARGGADGAESEIYLFHPSPRNDE